MERGYSCSLHFVYYKSISLSFLSPGGRLRLGRSDCLYISRCKGWCWLLGNGRLVFWGLHGMDGAFSSLFYSDQGCVLSSPSLENAAGRGWGSTSEV